MFNYLFLDIDGILNRHKLQKWSGCCGIRKKNIKWLNKLIEQYKVKIILTSAWRYLILTNNMSKTGFEIMMNTHGVDRNFKIYKLTDRDENIEKKYKLDIKKDGIKIREFQIKEIIEQEKMENFVIFDDLNLTNLPNFIKVDGNKGLTKKEFEKAKNIYENRK